MFERQSDAVGRAARTPRRPSVPDHHQQVRGADQPAGLGKVNTATSLARGLPVKQDRRSGEVVRQPFNGVVVQERKNRLDRS